MDTNNCINSSVNPLQADELRVLEEDLEEMSAFMSVLSRKSSGFTETIEYGVPATIVRRGRIYKILKTGKSRIYKHTEVNPDVQVGRRIFTLKKG